MLMLFIQRPVSTERSVDEVKGWKGEKLYCATGVVTREGLTRQFRSAIDQHATRPTDTCPTDKIGTKVMVDGGFDFGECNVEGHARCFCEGILGKGWFRVGVGRVVFKCSNGDFSSMSRVVCVVVHWSAPSRSLGERYCDGRG